MPPGRLWRAIKPARPLPGLPLPGRSARLRITARLAGGGADSLGAAPVTVAVQDAGGAVYLVAGCAPTAASTP